MPGLKKRLSNVKKGVISLDGWKSRRKDAILGFKFHFIDSDWKIRKEVIAIRALNVSQTGDAIKRCYDAVIKDLGLQDKVAYVMTDSGANMVKAFQPPKKR
ncbi:unnamed protein product [Allacma fusca]|uniref:Transposase n=1 Tax=Allacma fusca TaxID=39272 RepID=A0A8J2L2V3_9HEXA|nr:unnamed protein product [Allacma fusca]